MDMLMKKVIAFLLAAAMMSSCTVHEEEKKNQEINLTFSFWEPGVQNNLEQSLREIADEYETNNPNVHIELISKPVEIYNDWMNNSIIEGNMLDIEANHVSLLMAQNKQGIVIDIADYMEQESAYASGVKWKDTFLPERLHQVNTDPTTTNNIIPF